MQFKDFIDISTKAGCKIGSKTGFIPNKLIYTVEYNGKTGFITLNYVQPTSAPATTTNFIVKINTAALNVRKEPNAYSAITTTVKSGQVFTIVEERNGWGKLKSGAGWINLSYTKKL